MKLNRCHCEERSDAAIPRQHSSVIPAKAGIQSRRHCEQSEAIPRVIICITILCALIISHQSHAETIDITTEKIITRTITLAPGFATMIQFPDPVLSMDLADSRIVHCERSAVDSNMALCKPKTYELHSTNMIVSTEQNKFNLVMQIDPENKETSDSIIFKRSGEKQITVPKIDYPKKESLLNEMMASFKVESFKKTVSNDYGRLKTEQVLFVGDQIYLTFSVENANFMIYEVLRVDVYLENLGGMTGMSVRSEKLIPSEYRLSNHSISNGETAFGVVRFKNSILSEDQALSLRIVEKTDKRKDLYFKFDTGI